MEGDSSKGRSSRKTKAQLIDENDSLRQSEARFRTLAVLAPVAIYHADAQGLITYFNQRWSEFGGLSSEQAMGTGWIASVHPEDRERIAAEWNQAVRNERTFRAEYRFMHPEGMVTWCYDQAVAETDADGKPTGWVGCLTNITERKRAEEIIKASLEEKEVLLQEIHHQVKTNLQAVSSMLSLQASTETNTRSRNALKDSQRRVQVMARIHENLHQSDDLTAINARDYLNSVVEDTIECCGHDAQGISSRLDADDIVIDVDHAVDCGQIVSELLSNSLKHAFPDGQSGNIVVSLHRRDEGRIELTVADDGKGLPQDFDLEKAETLGMRLVHALAMEMNGVIYVDGSGGTRVQITFPEQPL